jgi:hypothetical protein
MTTIRRALSSLAAIALAAGLMTACGDEDDPDPDAGSEATSTAPEDPSDGGGATAQPSRPDVPKPDPKDYPGMDEHTDEGAEQAFRYFWAVMTWAYQTGDTSDFEALYGAECGSCQQNLDQIDELNKMEDWWSVTSIKDVDVRTYESTKNEIEVGYTMVLSAHSEPVNGNTKRRNFPDDQFSVVGGLSWQGDSWQVDAFDLHDDDE